jgi:hypothetical protein
LNIHGVNDVRQTEGHGRATNAWAQCGWGWDGYWKAKKTQITRYW